MSEPLLSGTKDLQAMSRQKLKVAVGFLTLYSPVMPFGIILLILFFICYNCSIFWDGEG
jgi:hypothetical protein